jgi:hypothetical protein
MYSSALAKVLQAKVLSDIGEDDFDFLPFLSRLFPYVINITSRFSLADPDT